MHAALEHDQYAELDVRALPEDEAMPAESDDERTVTDEEPYMPLAEELGLQSFMARFSEVMIESSEGIMELVSHRDIWRRRSTAAEQEVERLTAHITAVQSELDDTKERLVEAERQGTGQMTPVMAQLTAARDELINVKGQLDTSLEEVKIISDKHAGRDVYVARLRKDNETLRADRTASDRNLTACQAKAHAAEEESMKYMEELDTLRQSDLGSRLSVYQKENVDLKQQIISMDKDAQRAATFSQTAAATEDSRRRGVDDAHKSDMKRLMTCCDEFGSAQSALLRHIGDVSSKFSVFVDMVQTMPPAMASADLKQALGNFARQGSPENLAKVKNVIVRIVRDCTLKLPLENSKVIDSSSVLLANHCLARVEKFVEDGGKEKDVVTID